MPRPLTVPFLLLLCLAGWAVPGAAQRADGGIWDAAIMKQPFDKGVFRQVRVPEWVQGTVGCGYTLSGMDSRARAQAAAYGVTISEVNFVDPSTRTTTASC